MRNSLLANLISLLFLHNTLQLNIVEGEGGGNAGEAGDGGEGGEAGNAGGSGSEGGEGGNTGGNSGSDDGGSDDWKIDDLPAGAQKLIKDLRAESAKHRTTNKSLEERFSKLEGGLKSALGLEDEEDISPEEQITQLSSQNQGLEMRNALLEVALENGMDQDQMDYFGYLLQKAGDSLQDDEELTEEMYAELVNKAKNGVSSSGSKKANFDADGNNSPNGGNGGSDDGAISLEDFAKMTYSQKVALRQKNESLYNKLFVEAKGKRLV